MRVTNAQTGNQLIGKNVPNQINRLLIKNTHGLSSIKKIKQQLMQIRRQQPKTHNLTIKDTGFFVFKPVP